MTGRSGRRTIALALCALVAFGGPASADKVDDLVKTLRNDGDPKVRLSAALALGRLGDKRAIPAMTDALSDRDSKVRGVVAVFLGKLVDSSVDPAVRNRAIAELERVSKNDPDDFVRSQAEKSYLALKPLKSGSGSGSGSDDEEDDEEGDEDGEGGGAHAAVYLSLAMRDSTGSNLSGHMETAVKEVLAKNAPTWSLKWPGGKQPTAADLQQAKAMGFSLDVNLASLKVKKSGGVATVTCQVGGYLASYPDNKILVPFKPDRNTGEATSALSDIDKAKVACVKAIVGDLVKRSIMPEIARRCP